MPHFVIAIYNDHNMCIAALIVKGPNKIKVPEKTEKSLGIQENEG